MARDSRWSAVSHSIRLNRCFVACGGPLGPNLAYMPDGEVGVRRYWIDGIVYRVFNGHPEIETLRRPRPMQVASRAGGRWVCATNGRGPERPGRL